MKMFKRFKISNLQEYKLQVLSTCIVSLSYLSIGLVRAWASTSIPSIKSTDRGLWNQNMSSNFTINEETISWMVSAPPIGSCVGSLIVSFSLQFFGRRGTLINSGFLYMVGNLLIAIGGFVFDPWNIILIITGRVILGLAVGFACSSCVIFISETTVSSIRGTLGCIPALQLALGVLLGYCIGGVVSWKILTLLSIIPPLILISGCLKLPESPIWLSSKGQDVKCSESRIWFGLEDVKNCEGGSRNKEEQMSKDSQSRCLDVDILKPLLLSLGLQFVQIWSGVNVLVFKTVEIFSKSGSNMDAFVATAVVGVVQLFATAASIPLVDMAGRRPLLMISSFVMGISMALLGTCFYLGPENLANTWEWVPLFSMILAFIGYSIGYAGIPFLMIGELFSTRYRNIGGSISSMFNLLNLFITLKFFTQFAESVGYSTTFWMFAGINMLGSLFVLIFLPETKGKNLEDIKDLFSNKK